MGIVLNTTDAGLPQVRSWVVVFAILVLLNTAVDVVTEFDFYFPGVKHSTSRIFLAAPFTQMIGTDGTIDHGPFRSNLSLLIKQLQRRRYSVFSAHDREAWGEDIFSPTQALDEDLNEIERADVVVALIVDPPSPGVQLEIGVALALGKPIVQITEVGLEAEKIPYLNRAFSEAGSPHNVYLLQGCPPNQWGDGLVTILNRIAAS